MLAEVVAAAALGVGGWHPHAPLPVGRAETCGVDWREYAVVIGGLLADGAPSARADAYNARTDEWTRLPDLPVPISHPMAATGSGSLYVFGGGGTGRGVFAAATA